MRLHAIINIQSGEAGAHSSKKLERKLLAIWQSAGHHGRVTFSNPKHLNRDIRHASTSPEVDMVVIGGGDGTISKALPDLLTAEKCLGILPMGTMNYMARQLGLPLDPIAAAMAITSGHATTIDLASINGRPFMIWCCLGLLPHYIIGRDKLRRGKSSGIWDSMLSGLQEVALSPLSLPLAVIIDGEATQVETPFLMVTNNECRDSPPLLLMRDRLDGGMLGLYFAKDPRLLSVSELGLQALLGQWAGNSQLTASRSTHIEIQGRQPGLTVSIDGEIAHLSPPLHFQILPKALRVQVPNEDL